MVLEGVVTNVAAFGAFVDVGVHQDGLVHVSALSHTFVKDPREVVKSGDVVKVRVLEVDDAAQADLADPAPGRRAEPGRASARRPPAGQRPEPGGGQPGQGGQGQAASRRPAGRGQGGQGGSARAAGGQGGGRPGWQGGQGGQRQGRGGAAAAVSAAAPTTTRWPRRCAGPA